MTPKEKFSYDPACEELAKHFHPQASEEAIRRLAQEIQDAVEEFDFSNIPTENSNTN